MLDMFCNKKNEPFQYMSHKRNVISREFFFIHSDYDICQKLNMVILRLYACVHSYVYLFLCWFRGKSVLPTDFAFYSLLHWPKERKNWIRAVFGGDIFSFYISGHYDEKIEIFLTFEIFYFLLIHSFWRAKFNLEIKWMENIIKILVRISWFISVEKCERKKSTSLSKCVFSRNSISFALR